MQKTVTLDNVASTINYLWGYQYKDGVLQFFPTAEGYVSDVLDEGADHFNYVYNYTDHLGNIRLSYSKSETGALKIMEENNYYPFGLKHENYNVQKYTYTTFGDVRVGPRTIVLEATERMGYQYKFQGQERQDELGLNWDSFKWRNYDYAIGRFMSIDPLAEKYPYNGVYNFSENRVIDGRELEGLEVQLIVEKPNIKQRSPGHTFVTVGSGKNMTAYTYGRWAGAERSSGGNSANPLGNGPGVLIKLTGKDAMNEVKKYVNNYGSKVYEVDNTSENIVRANFDEQFNSTSKTPESGIYKGDERAHVIDKYDITENNCTTKSLDAVSEGHGGDITYKTTTVAGGFPVIQTDSTDNTYRPSTLAAQLQQATKDTESDIREVTNKYIEKK